MRTISNNKSKGFTLIELMIAILFIAVAGALIVAKWRPIKATFYNGNETEAAITLTNTIKQTASGGSFGSGDLLKGISGQEPGAWTVGGSSTAPTITNLFNGTVTATGAGNLATIKSTNYPDSTCRAMVSQISQGFRDAVITAGSKSWPAGSQLSAQDAADGCTGGSNTVQWQITALN